MKTREEIEKRIAELKADERLGYPPANVFTNAPLALIQVALKNEIMALNWVLKESEKKEEMKE
mgnify:CR=1 FL=1|jgi:hypothetical protein